MNVTILLEKIKQHIDVSMELIQRGDHYGAYEFLHGTRLAIHDIETDIYKDSDEETRAKLLFEENEDLKLQLEASQRKLSKLMRENDERSNELAKKENDILNREKELKKLQDRARKKERQYKTKLLEDSIARHKAM